MFRSIHICVAFLLPMVFSFSVLAQTPPPAPTSFTGSASAGLAMTGGNTDTSNFNLATALTKSLETKNVLKFTGLYLRGHQNDVLAVDRTSANLRDEHTLSPRTFMFGQLEYFRDKFKDIIFLYAPTGGVGFKVVNSETTLLQFDGGVGGVWEKNPGLPIDKSGSVTTGQRFTSKMSPAVGIVQSITTVWKMDDFGDSLSNFSLGVTTAMTSRIELKVEFVDSYKSKPANVETQRNDTAFVTSLGFRF